MDADVGVPQDVLDELAPDGTLRVGINTANELLVSSVSADGVPHGVAPDVAAEVARQLGVAVRWVLYSSPAALADAAEDHAWDIGLLGAEPARAQTIAFTPAYAGIPATYLVPAGSPIVTLGDADRPGVRICVPARGAYDLWLSRNIRHATLVRAPTVTGAYDMFVRDGLDALAGLRVRLLAYLERTPGARVLDGAFMSVQQAVGTPRANRRAAEFLSGLVNGLISAGFVAGSIARRGAAGLLPAGAP